VDKDILGGISRFAKRKTLHYDMSLVIFRKISIGNFFMIRVTGSVLCNFAAMEKSLARFDVRKTEF
jgi:hypothetical protein